MRDATTSLVENLYQRFGPFMEPVVEIGGAESSDQFRHIFSKYEVWDIRNLPGVDSVVDARTMWSGQTILGDGLTNKVGTVMTFDTLEHIFEVGEVAQQIGRMVHRPGGLVVVGVPWMAGFHDPSGDYWRMSHQALERLFGPWFDRLESGYYDDNDAGSYYIGRRRNETREFVRLTI